MCVDTCFLRFDSSADALICFMDLAPAGVTDDLRITSSAKLLSAGFLSPCEAPPRGVFPKVNKQHAINLVHRFRVEEVQTLENTSSSPRMSMTQQSQPLECAVSEDRKSRLVNQHFLLAFISYVKIPRQ